MFVCNEHVLSLSASTIGSNNADCQLDLVPLTFAKVVKVLQTTTSPRYTRSKGNDLFEWDKVLARVYTMFRSVKD
jgi:hypothetical protein